VSGTPRTPFRVLFVDDDSATREGYRAFLAGCGYDVMPAATGIEALSLASTSAPDVIVLDLGLPDIDGKDVTGRVREWSDVPVLILSVRDDAEEKVAALDAWNRMGNIGSIPENQLVKPSKCPEPPDNLTSATAC